MSRCRHDMVKGSCAFCQQEQRRRRAAGTAGQSRKKGNRVGPGSAVVGASPTDPRHAALIARRRRGLQDAEKALRRAEGGSVDGLREARDRLMKAKERLRHAESLARTSKATPKSSGRPSAKPAPPPGPRAPSGGRERDGAERSSPPQLDPDLSGGFVWVLPHGGSYHRRDCHVIETRSSGVQLKGSTARQLGLRRCEHCSPLA